MRQGVHFAKQFNPDICQFDSIPHVQGEEVCGLFCHFGLGLYPQKDNLFHNRRIGQKLLAPDRHRPKCNFVDYCKPVKEC